MYDDKLQAGVIPPLLRCFATGAIVLFVALSILSCAGKRPSLGVSDSRLAPCPSSPNCVSSDARDNTHEIPPLQLGVTPTETWQVVLDIVSKLPRTHIVKKTSDYLHAECRSAVFGFVDDLELYLHPSEGIIAVRSASRLGYSDFGVNRRRVEDLRTSLINQTQK